MPQWFDFGDGPFEFWGRGWWFWKTTGSILVPMEFVYTTSAKIKKSTHVQWAEKMLYEGKKYHAYIRLKKNFLVHNFKGKYRSFIKSHTHPLLKSQLVPSTLCISAPFIVGPAPRVCFFLCFPKAKVTFQTLLQNRLIRIIK